MRRLLAQRKICHVHATSSRALICGLLLKKTLSVSLSASIEVQPVVSHELLESAFEHAIGGRIADRKLSERIGPPFFFDRPASNGALVRGLRWLKPVSRIDLTASGRSPSRRRLNGIVHGSPTSPVSSSTASPCASTRNSPGPGARRSLSGFPRRTLAGTVAQGSVVLLLHKL